MSLYGSWECERVVVMDFALHLSTLLSVLTHCSAQWCYKSQYSCDNTCRDPSRWPGLFPDCGGLRQSPINIVTNHVQANHSLSPLTFYGHHNILNITVENMGHSAHFSLPSSVQVSGGGLAGRYRAIQFHLHWGVDAGPGSEHTVDGEHYPMELHIVHIKEPYNSLEEAEHDKSGIALLAFLFEESNDDHHHYNSLIEALGRVQNNGNQSTVPGFRLCDIIPPSHDLHDYYRYVGSMTTPGCEQAVVWTLFHRTIPVSNRQLVSVAQQAQFWTGQPMTGIFRPVQPLNGRTVYRSATSPVQPGLITVWLYVLLSVLGRALA
ncbi:carbonic anhydrase IV c [Coregonus clupeaformis]|uniref:carbonic anhydrase IV c n=1 Tax=Coregonus clupeaformis TaxID=59861 RepID=UPI001BE0EFA2|nr:carbonic anhydrase IV c [Coregonus clupeaformis]